MALLLQVAAPWIYLSLLHDSMEGSWGAGARVGFPGPDNTGEIPRQADALLIQSPGHFFTSTYWSSAVLQACVRGTDPALGELTPVNLPNLPLELLPLGDAGSPLARLDLHFPICKIEGSAERNVGLLQSEAALGGQGLRTEDLPRAVWPRTSTSPLWGSGSSPEE